MERVFGIFAQPRLSQPEWSEVHHCFKCNDRAQYYWSCPNPACPGPTRVRPGDYYSPSSRRIFLCTQCRECPFCHMKVQPSNLEAIPPERISSEANGSTTSTVYGSTASEVATVSNES